MRVQVLTDLENITWGLLRLTHHLDMFTNVGSLGVITAQCIVADSHMIINVFMGLLAQQGYDSITASADVLYD